MKNRNINNRKHIWRKIILYISAVVILFVAGIFIGLFLRNKQLIFNEILERARSHFSDIVLTRRWNAGYGGVFVEKKPGVISNPYLENPDIFTIDGKVYTKKNPALMTKEISKLADISGNFNFHITSLKPLNPENTPDMYEYEALKLFEQGRKDIYRNIIINGETTFWYMAPLMVEKSCLKCHAKQGYRIGDVRGGISVKFNISEIIDKLTWHKYIIILLSIFSVVLIIGIIYYIINSFSKKLENAHNKIRELAVTDELTGINNRRYLNSKLKDELNRALRFRHSLTCIMLDLDYFKLINDKYGHHEGDIVLKEITGIFIKYSRDIDTIARFGGEEFVIILPRTDIEDGVEFAERIRKQVENHRSKFEDIEIKITISIGVYCAEYDDLKNLPDESHIIINADNALYRAKENGRNRVEVFNKSDGQDC